jgi:hypothetical protein
VSGAACGHHAMVYVMMMLCYVVLCCAILCCVCVINSVFFFYSVCNYFSLFLMILAANEFTQRLFFPTILSRTATTMTLRAPDNPTVMLGGYYMLFLVNGNTPSLGKWITLGAA